MTYIFKNFIIIVNIIILIFSNKKINEEKRFNRKVNNVIIMKIIFSIMNGIVMMEYIIIMG